MKALPEPHFDLWIPAVATGLLPLARLIAWADQQIMRLREPPPWLIELSLCTDVERLLRAREYVPEDACREEFDQGRVHLGAMYLAFERGLLPMNKLLLEAGQFADCCSSTGLPDCEAFFLLLNEIDGGGPTMPSDRPLAERVQELFAPMIEEARVALVNLPSDTATV